MKLRLEQIGHSYFGKSIIENFNLTLEPGEVVALIGPSGCGKTTILQIAAGLVDATSGSITRAYSRHAVVFQEPRLLPWMTTLDNIAYGLRVSGTPRGAARAAAAERALQVGLEVGDFAKYPVELSGGMRQRAAVARALAVRPEVLYFDEPFTAVDVGLKRVLQDLVIEAAARESFSALFVTHDLAEAVRIADRLLVLSTRQGGVIAEHDIAGLPGQRSNREIFELVEEWSSDPAFAELFGHEDRVRA
ncbi:MAG: nitrate/sulfonate/bicarbonate ABC transporter ATP-binding protein [Pelagibacterium sp. SCN 64-44]|nr:MAG: nitrate/sulfonate/bicarbonate ABC transporter ATP-binding protein [Pelagibacterium sp. SCN 64-44]